MTKLNHEISQTLVDGLRSNAYQYHQFYNIDITPEENNLLIFKSLFKENEEMKRLNKTYYDIEVINNEDEFPDPNKVKFPVNSVATYNNIKNEGVIFAVLNNTNITDPILLEKLILEKYTELCKENEAYIVDDIKIKLVICSDEKELLDKFFSYLKECRTLILMGFNNRTFDDPYMINRTKKLFGDDGANDVVTDFGEIREYNKSYSILDYNFVDLLYLYKPIDSGGAGYGKSLPDFKLNTIIEKELKIKKLELDGNFWNSYHNDIVGFLTYNLIDTISTFKLDEKLKFTELIFELGKHNKSTFASSLTGRSIMFKQRNNHIFTEQGKLIRTKKFSEEICYPVLDT